MSEYLELGDDLEAADTPSLGSITTVEMSDAELELAREREQERQPFGFQA